jgi:gamma-glutamyltranspeptidase / glutathione hydrolase
VKAMMDDGAWRVDGATPSRVREAFGVNGAVASNHPVAAAIGTSVLQTGGNAIDAAIAVAAAEGVLLPMMCGLGGDAFVIVWDAKRQRAVAFNGSGVAGKRATRDLYASQGLKKMPLDGVHSVSVPGAVSVYETLWKRYGTREWADLWAPAIRLARDGVAINPNIAHGMADRASVLGKFKWSREQYLPTGRTPSAGERWAAPNLARSMELVAKGGAETFYRGELAERMVAFLKAEGGPFEAEDFACQQAMVYEPLRTEYRDATVLQTAPPSQGFLMLEQLNILEGFDLGGLGLASDERIHLLVEAKKLAFDDRNREAGDPAFVSWDVQKLISKPHAERRRAEIDPRRAGRPGVPLVAEHSGDTTYFTVVDGDGNAVSFIHSLSAAFGSAVVAGDTGITLNNRAGRGFNLEEGHPNVIEPGRRTMHTLNCYMVLRDGKPWIVGGTPGGDQQTQVNTQIVTSMVDQGLTPGQAMEVPRWFSFPGTDPATIDQPMTIRLEGRVPDQTLYGLTERGHVVEVLGPWGGGGAVQLIQIDQASGVLRGATDPRTGGAALAI